MSEPLSDQVDALVGAVMPPSPPTLSERTPIPAPLMLTGGLNRLGCPECPRSWRSRRNVAAYELHWRLTHDVKRAV